MATIHMVMQGKGGVGKSLCSSLLVQYLTARDQVVRAYDTDPVNNTLAGYKAFGVRVIEIMVGDDIDPRGFDPLLEELHGLGADTHAIIDNGAASFVPLGSYLAENDAISMLQAAGHTVYFHTVITGGQALGDTVDGLRAIVQSFPDSPVVVWLNRFFGEIAAGDGRSFEEFKVATEYGDRFHALVNIPFRKAATFGRDLESLFAKRQTFAEAAADESLPLMTRQRCVTWWADMCRELDKAMLA